VNQCRACGQNYNCFGQELRPDADYSETRSEQWMDAQVGQEGEL
jgi:hypothetical protein